MNIKILFHDELSTLTDLKVFLKKALNQIQFPAILLFDGPLGAGKTESIKKICSLLGASEVLSPTFALHLRYSGKWFDQSELQIDHLDLYRTETEHDIESLGFWDLFECDELSNSIPTNSVGTESVAAKSSINQISTQKIILVEWGIRIKPEEIPLNWNLYFINLNFGDSQDQDKRLIEFSMRRV